MKSTSMIIQCSDTHDIAQTGGKAYALWRLLQEGFRVPPWFVVTPQAFDGDQLKPEARDAIEQSLASLGLADKALAARSSAVEEDAGDASFAGQFESLLGVSAANLPSAIVEVWKSGQADRVQSYRTAQGRGGEPSRPAVLVQQMVDAEVAGVAFSVDPVSANWSYCIVSGVFGLGSTLVDGLSDADEYTIDREGKERERRVARKTKQRRLRAGTGFRLVENDLDEAQGTRPCLSTEQAQEVADLARRCEAFFGRPQDIEWALAKGRLWLLQSRPITTLRNVPDPQGKLFIWDNSNIAESYSGITLPLTFSFARYIYTEVYRQFCRLLSVPQGRIDQNRAVFGQMLGLIRGRVYYNLISWYKVLALLPGYELNRGFMEGMMGVKEPLSADAQKEVDTVRARRGKLADGLGLARSLLSLIYRHWTIERQSRRFQERLDAALAQPSTSLEAMRLDELADHFHHLESALLTKWDAPLINDFLAMVFFGLLKRLSEKWIRDAPASLHNDLICEMGNIISAEPAKRMRQMAGLAADDPELIDRLRHGAPGEIRQAVAARAELQREIDSYFQRFGDRCLDELKLESSTLVDDPLPFYRSIGELAWRGDRRRSAKADGAMADTRQSDAEEKAFRALQGSPIKRAAFRWVLKHARRRISGRENLRFERTRLFGRIRRVFVEMGRRLHAFNVINDPRDVFYLEIHEILGFVEGTASTTELRPLARIRTSEYTRFAEAETPADRFQTRGAVPVGNLFQPEAPSAEEAGADSLDALVGIGCCPGVVQGIARVVSDPQSAQLRHGEILVAKQTDPGWIMLFPLAAGLLVERGSLLSHSAIVSRELGLPAVVSVNHLLNTIRSGDLVELNGSTGAIRILKRADEAS